MTVDEKVYEGLHLKIGRGNISQFIESLIRPYVINKNLEAVYKQIGGKPRL